MQRYVYEDPLYRADDEASSTRGKYNTSHPLPDPSVVPVSSGPSKPTPSRDFGPFFVNHAPFRGTLLPLGFVGNTASSESVPKPGDWLVVSGHVKNSTGQHLPYATLDVWQASPSGEYDYREKDGKFRPYLTYIGELNDHSESEKYHFRARILTNEHGSFEYTSVIPVPYLDPEDNTWRCPHIHHFIQAQHHASCVTQIMFEGLEKNDTDNHIR